MTLVFQYGSNCLERVINSSDRLDDVATFYNVAKTVANYTIKFDIYARSKNRQCGAADIIKLGRSIKSEVWGIIWDVPDYRVFRIKARQRGVKSFDQIEGEGTNYRRRRILVQCPNGKKHMPITYVVINPNPQGVPTSEAYAKLIIDGLREHIKDGIPPEYIEEVKQIVTTNNPLIDATRL